MCCGDDAELGLPAAVIEMLARYRDLQRRHGWDWGSEKLPDYFRWARFDLIGPVMEHAGENGDFAAALRTVIGDGPVPAGIVVIDCQMSSAHLESLGARRIPRARFQSLVREHVTMKPAALRLPTPEPAAVVPDPRPPGPAPT